MIWLSADVWFKWFWLSIGLRFKWVGCQLIWDSSVLVVNWFEVQMIWMSSGVRFKWFGCQVVWDSIDLVVKWFGIQVIWLSTGLGFKRVGDFLFCETSFKNETLKLKNEAFVRDFLQKWNFEAQKRSFCARLPSKLKLWNSKTKLLCETSFKNETLKLKNEAFVRDFLQKWNFEAQKRSFCARLPSKNETLKLKNEAFVRDFLQKWNFEAQKRSFCARLPSKMKLWSSKTKLLCETSFKNDMLTGHLASEFQYVLAILKWTLQKYCACHEKVEPRQPGHTNSRNCHAKLSLLSDTSVAWNLQPFHRFSVRGFKHRHHKARNPCTCHAKSIEKHRKASFRTLFKSTTPAHVLATLTNSCACHVFGNVSKSLRLPREKHFECPKKPQDRQLLTILTSKSLSHAGVVQILSTSWAADAPHHAFRTWLSEPPKPRNYGKTQHFAQFLPAKISHV